MRSDKPCILFDKLNDADAGIGSFRQKEVKERKKAEKLQKNGIHYCVCQFFFVILQPIYVRECANART